ncbi:MAG: hypothetical protein M1835_007959 [Candelina submexicana]|nr:MAG: hypothetical protein M1835_007959 [Candelina submexicana]
MQSVISLLLRAVSFSYGLLTLAYFISLALRDGAFLTRSSERAQNELAIARDKLWNLSKPPGRLRHAFFRLRNGLRLHYAISDSQNLPLTKPINLIIFLHGFPDSWAIWRPLMQAEGLEKHGVLIAVDLPGFGGSDNLSKYGSTEVLGAVTEFLIGMRNSYVGEQGCDGKVLVVGHDWGCTVLYRLAAEAPQLADRFILSNSFYPQHLHDTGARIMHSSSKMLAVYMRHPISSRSLLRKARNSMKPLLSQLYKSGYVFVFNLPLPLATFCGSMGNFWFLRLLHRFAAGSKRPLESSAAAEALANSLGPGVNDCNTYLDDKNLESYPDSVRKRAHGGAWSQMIRLYRDGVASEPWEKPLELLRDLHNLDGGRRSSSGEEFIEGGPKGKLKAKVTIVWGKQDLAVDLGLALEGIGDYLVKGSQVILLPRVGHWVPNEKEGRAVLAQVISWAAQGEAGDVGSIARSVYEEAEVMIQR